MDIALINVSALAAFLPASLQALRRQPSRDALFWAVIGLATAAALARVGWQLSAQWETGLAATLWVTVAITLAIYTIVAAVAPQAWRLAPMVATYMILLGAIATVWQRTPGQPLVAGSGEAGWIGVHIATSVTTYGLVTIAAIAALAAFLQERALKRKKPTSLTRLLPSLAGCETLVVRLLLIAEVVLAVGLVTGMALQYREMGAPMAMDHKTILSIAAFIVLAILLVAHHVSGVRGRRAARMVLLAYLLLTLGYPGVKFVTDVLIG
ncbi:MAG: cytochrome c biogenesis protein CcsA [Rhodospirillales bacterium]|nr:cytochrome c biogenesis protein CcsA [Rhodospirillales bacterium]